MRKRGQQHASWNRACASEARDPLIHRPHVRHRLVLVDNRVHLALDAPDANDSGSAAARTVKRHRRVQGSCGCGQKLAG